mmetsp:Transcript_60265/g.140852  ORF Transcript_60265/g.140852 Transcript_60265/m.140852 type:complete len:201 (+) Transcript_60265:59-661(+)
MPSFERGRSRAHGRLPDTGTQKEQKDPCQMASWSSEQLRPGRALSGSPATTNPMHGAGALRTSSPEFGRRHVRSWTAGAERPTYQKLAEDAESVCREVSPRQDGRRQAEEVGSNGSLPEELVEACAALGRELEEFHDHLTWAERIGCHLDVDLAVDTQSKNPHRGSRLCRNARIPAQSSNSGRESRVSGHAKEAWIPTLL